MGLGSLALVTIVAIGLPTAWWLSQASGRRRLLAELLLMIPLLTIFADLVGRPGQAFRQRDSQQLIDCGAPLSGQFLLHLEHVHLVVVHRMQGGGGR